jgi:hypothetical protein
MIVLILTREHGHRTGWKENIVSHGVDLDTDKTVILPFEQPLALGAVYNDKLGEWVLPT